MDGHQVLSLRVQGSGQALGDEGLGDLDEASDVCTVVVVAGCAVLLGGVAAPSVDIFHYLFELLVGVLEGPGLTAGVLLHLQGRDGHAAGVGGLAGAVGDAGVQESVHGIWGAGHVRPFADRHAAVLYELVGVSLFEFVLGGAGEGYVARYLPDIAPVLVARPLVGVGVLGDAAAFL